VTERRGRVVNTYLSYSGGPGFKSRLGDPLAGFTFFVVFPQFLQANAGMVPKIRQRPLPSKSFPIHHSLITPLFDAILSEFLKKRC
jgi:hypothetical protein